MEEIWKDVIIYKNGKLFDYTNKYQVSNLGRVRSFKFNKWYVMKQSFDLKSGGYYRVQFTKDHNIQTFLVHRLVATMFIPNPENKPEVDHIIPSSMGGTNEVNNLRWVTRKENNNNELTLKNVSEARKGEKHGMWGKRKEDSPHAKPIVRVDSENNIKIYPSINSVEDTFTPPNISNACKNKFANKKHMYKGYQWYYVEDYIIKFMQIHIEK